MADDNEQKTTDEPVEAPPTSESEIEAPEGAQNPDAVKAALQAERQAVKAAKAQVRDLRTEVKDLQERIAEYESDKTSLSEVAGKVPSLEATIARYEVAAEKGLDLKLANRITGSSREEMEADADELKTLLGISSSAGFDGGARESVPAKGTPEQEHNKFLADLLSGKVQP